MAMEELDEFEVLWPETCCHPHEPPPSSSPAPVQAAQPSDAPEARSRPVDVPSPRSRPVDVPSPRSWRPRSGGDDHDDDDGSAIIVPPHQLLSGWRRSETETAAWSMLRASGPPGKRARDLRHLRDSVLRMTGFIEG